MLRARTVRRQTGNMLILVCSLMTLIGMGLTLGLSFGGVFFAQVLLQNYANEMALSGACLLNSGDKADQQQGINANDCEGQMNNMIVRCRSLVHESRLNNDNAKSENKEELIPLADELLEESKQSAQDLEAERRNLKQEVELEATNEIKQQVAKVSKFNLLLPWIQCKSVRLATSKGITFGQVRDVQSNVKALDENNNLKYEDQSNGYVRQKSNTYKANINARLDSENSLDFHISSLQPPVKNEVAPARVILPSAFMQSPQASLAQGDLNSAVRVTLIMDLETKLASNNKSQIKVSGYAVTTGGADVRQEAYN